MAKGRFGTVREAGVLDEAATAAELLYTRLCLDLSVKHLCGGEPLHRRGCSLCAESNSLGWQAGIFCLVSDGTARRAREHGSLPQDSQPLRPPSGAPEPPRQAAHPCAAVLYQVDTCRDPAGLRRRIFTGMCAR